LKVQYHPSIPRLKQTLILAKNGTIIKKFCKKISKNLNFSSDKTIYYKTTVIMIDLQPLFGFDVNRDENGNIGIDIPCSFPQDNKNCQIFFDKLELIKIDESKIAFPLMLKDWLVTITPDNKETIKKYFEIDGIKRVVEEHKAKLVGKTTFIKPEIYYPRKSKYPNLIIHFYQLVNDGGVLIDDAYDMVEYCKIFYYDTKQFTKKRIADLEKYVNTQELFQIPFLPLEIVRFDKIGNLMDFEQHKLALTGIELPF